MALACNYTAVANEGGWSLLRHGENRCSEPRSLGVQTVRPGEKVATPTVETNEILVARFTPRPDDTLLHTLGRAVFKDRSPLLVTADDHMYRLPKALADGPFMVAFPATLGWSDQFSGLHYKRLAFNEAGSLEFQVIGAS